MSFPQMRFSFLLLLFLSEFSFFIQSSRINSKLSPRPPSASSSSAVGGSPNVNYADYVRFLEGVLSIDQPDTLQIINSHAETNLLTAQAHNAILDKFIQLYAYQLKTFPFKERVVEEAFCAYLRYVLKRNFDKERGFALPSAHQLKVLQTFNFHFTKIALNLFHLKRSSFNEILFKEMTKELELRTKIMLLKEVIKACDHRTTSSDVFLLMFQAFIKTCPETFSSPDTIVTLYTTSICSTWAQQLFMAPIHFALLRIDSDLEVTRKLLTRFSRQQHSFNHQEIVSVFDRVLHSTNFLAKHQLFPPEEQQKRSQIVYFIVKFLFPGKAFYEILTELASFDEILVFELVLQYEIDRHPITKMQFISTLDYIVLCAAFRFSDIIYTSIMSAFKVEDLLIKFNLEILLIMIAYSPPIKHKILDKIEPIPGTSPLALSVIYEIVQQIIAIVATFPQTKLSLRVAENDSEFIYLPEPQIPYQTDLTTAATDLLDRFPVYIYTARIFLYKVFSIPLAATRFLDSVNESVTWGESVAFINFYIERFAQISNIETFYKIISQ